jgi:hypothetical protein
MGYEKINILLLHVLKRGVVSRKIFVQMNYFFRETFGKSAWVLLLLTDDLTLQKIEKTSQLVKADRLTLPHLQMCGNKNHDIIKIFNLRHL